MDGVDHYRNVVVVDFEYEIDDGDLPRVLCMVAYVLDAALRHVRTIRRWRGEFGSTPPFDIGPDTLFVALLSLGGDDVLSGAGLALPGSHLRFTHGLPFGFKHPAAAQSRRGA